jgi:CheY-like chemotaxis protein
MRITPKILFIDDDRFFLEFYRAELAQFNISTEFAMDGEEGIKKAKELKPDVILLDVVLPKKDGFEVLAELKADPETKNVPVIIVSTLNSEQDKAELLRLGAVQTFNKLGSLPKDVVAYVQESFASGQFKLVELPESKAEGTELSREQINGIFSESLQEIERSFTRLFSKSPVLDDVNVSLIPMAEFKKNIAEMAKEHGTIFIYSSIEAKEPGAVLLSMKRNAALSLIKLIEEGAVGKELGLTINDQVVEEFFNIIINAFLTKLSKSVGGRLVMRSPIITNPKTLLEKVSASDVVKKDQLVVFLEEAYRIEELDLSFSLFVTFGSGLFTK